MKRLTLIPTFLILIAVPALAGQQAGDSEFQLQGSLFLDTGDSQSTDSGSVAVVLGRFTSDQTELGVQAGAFFNADGDIGGVGGPFWRYNFGTSEVVPYVGAAVFGSFGDFGSGDFLGQVEGGVRYFVSRSTAFTVAGSQYYDFDASELSDVLVVQFGFSHIWGD